MSKPFRTAAIAIALALALVLGSPMPQASAQNPDFMLEVNVEVQELKARVGGIVVICGVYAGDLYNNIGRNTKTVALPGNTGPKAYRGVVSVPISVRAPHQAAQATHYKCELQMYGDANWTEPVKGPAPAIWDWKTARPDRPFVPVIEGRIPGR